MRVCPIHRRRRRPWRQGSRIIAGQYTNCWRFICRCLAGYHPSNVGVPHIRSNASLSDGAGTTVSCGVTLRRASDLYHEFQGNVKISTLVGHLRGIPVRTDATGSPGGCMREECTRPGSAPCEREEPPSRYPCHVARLSMRLSRGPRVDTLATVFGRGRNRAMEWRKPCPFPDPMMPTCHKRPSSP
jgi:hypothetical protein